MQLPNELKKAAKKAAYKARKAARRRAKKRAAARPFAQIESREQMFDPFPHHETKRRVSGRRGKITLERREPITDLCKTTYLIDREGRVERY